MKKIELNVSKIWGTLSNAELKLGTYRYIMDSLHNTDVSKDAQYQHVYKTYYGMMRFTPNDFCLAYFQYMNSNKTDNIEFGDIITHLYNATGRVEPSFSSKLLHTLSPDMPIWDSRILYHLEWKKPYYSPPKVIAFYSEMTKRFEEYLGTANAAEVVKMFDELHPNTGLTALKKIDNAIWSLGPKPKKNNKN